MKVLDRLIVNFVLLFLVVERTPCDEPECRCKSHEVLAVRPLGWYTMLAFMIAMGLYSCSVTHGW